MAKNSMLERTWREALRVRCYQGRGIIDTSLVVSKQGEIIDGKISLELDTTNFVWSYKDNLFYNVFCVALLSY